jgi:ribosomal-protein-alanine N-acetyltransferase
MKQRPTLHTERLILRPFTNDDAPAVEHLAGAYEVALNTLLIPHPYPEGAAEEWIAHHDEDFRENRIHHFAIEVDGELIGAIGLVIKSEGIGEIGYWLGVPFWNRGYVSEAAAEVVRYGFEDCGMDRIFACHFKRNPASGRILQKLGMQYEGTLRRHLLKWGERIDLAFYGILREEWEARRSAG